jgi:uncharacterized protein YecE (DUF72 family)
MPGQLYAGTSGFAYPGWAPRFYPRSQPDGGFLSSYAARLSAVELNNTLYRRPDRATVERWLAQTPPDFRFCPKAQRGAAWRAWTPAAPEAMVWLADALAGFGERLGTVLLSAPSPSIRDDAALARLLAARPADLPLTLELPHPSWSADEVHAQLAGHGVALVASDQDGQEEPDLRRIGRILYLRLRRASYGPDALARWVDRLAPFLTDGMDAYVFFRHDSDGESALRAEAMQERWREVRRAADDGVG